MISGRRAFFPLPFPLSHYPPLSFLLLFDLTITSSPVFMSDVYPGAAWEMAGLKKTFEKIYQSKLSPLIMPQVRWDSEKKASELEHCW